MVFHQEDWQVAVSGVDPNIIRGVLIAALELSEDLPVDPDDSEVSGLPGYVETLQHALTSLRFASSAPDRLPDRECSDLELALWAIGLTHHWHIHAAD